MIVLILAGIIMSFQGWENRLLLDQIKDEEAYTTGSIRTGYLPIWWRAR